VGNNNQPQFLQALPLLGILGREFEARQARSEVLRHPLTQLFIMWKWQKFYPFLIFWTLWQVRGFLVYGNTVLLCFSVFPFRNQLLLGISSREGASEKLLASAYIVERKAGSSRSPTS